MERVDLYNGMHFLCFEQNSVIWNPSLPSLCEEMEYIK